MSLSSTGLQAALASWTTEVFLECLTFDHASLGSPIRLVNDTQDLVRTAGTFTAFPFDIKLPSKSDDRISEAEVVASNVDRQLVQALRGISGDKPTCMYEVVLLGSPNTIEFGPATFEILGFTTVMGSISMRISFDMKFLNEAFPKDYFAPWNAT